MTANRPYPHPSARTREGVALVTTLLVVSIIGVLVAGSLILSVTNQRISMNDATSTQAVYAAQAGNAYWRAELVSLYQHMIENFELYEDEINQYILEQGRNISCGNYLAIGVDIDRDGAVDVKPGRPLPTVTVPVGATTASVRTTFNVNGSAVQLDGRSSVNGALGRIVEQFNISNVDLWNNAVFAETGAANATIQGRAEIRGAVHILGEGLSASDKALDISGSFGLGNTYRGLNSSLGVNASEMRLTQPDPTDLCATLRVRSGYVQMGGSAQVGYTESANAEPFIDQMRGIYTNHGFSSGAAEEVNIFSENGMYAAYDAGDTYRFPGLSDLNDDGISYAQALKNNAFIIDLSGGFGPIGALGPDDDRLNLPRSSTGLKDGDFYISGCDVPMFGINVDGSQTLIAKNTKKGNGTSTAAASGFVLKHDATLPFHCIKYRYRAFGDDEVVTEVRWDLSKNELYVGGKGGVVMLKGGDLLITGSTGSKVEIGYKGEGIVFVEDSNGDGAGGVGGKLGLEVDFLPAAGKAAVVDADSGRRLDVANPNLLTNAPANSYPATAILGLVARTTLDSLGAQKRFTAALYADQSVNIIKQTLVAGAIVTRTFDAGSQVPTVLYVPNLSERLPELMPGAGGFGYAVSNVSFSRQ